jgi:hypothetical protein
MCSSLYQLERISSGTSSGLVTLELTQSRPEYVMMRSCCGRGSLLDFRSTVVSFGQFRNKNSGFRQLKLIEDD